MRSYFPTFRERYSLSVPELLCSVLADIYHSKKMSGGKGNLNKSRTLSMGEIVIKSIKLSIAWTGWSIVFVKFQFFRMTWQFLKPKGGKLQAPQDFMNSKKILLWGKYNQYIITDLLALYELLFLLLHSPFL